MHILDNPFYGHGVAQATENYISPISTDANKVRSLLDCCPAAKPTVLKSHPALAAETGVAELWLKDERSRMGLGSFKACGAAYVIAHDASMAIDAMPSADLKSVTPDQLKTVLKGQTYICASAGNHGLSVAAGARIFGANAVIYLSETVPDDFAERLRDYGASVVRAGKDYESSMAASVARADREGWHLLSDTSWPGYTDVPTRVMEGYLIVAAEIVEQLADQASPTHVFLQAGVGGLAASLAAYLRQHWGDELSIVVVEPDAAPALYRSIEAGKVLVSEGPESNMGRLDCKEASHLAFVELAYQANYFALISDQNAASTTDWLADYGVTSTPSGVAGLAVLKQSQAGNDIRKTLGLDSDSRVLAIITEQA